VREAVIHALLYVGVARGAVNERGFEPMRRIRRARGELPLSEFKALVRALTRKAIDKAKAGDTIALRLCLDLRLAIRA
jgi:hypothetical protein